MRIRAARLLLRPRPPIGGRPPLRLTGGAEHRGPLTLTTGAGQGRCSVGFDTRGAGLTFLFRNALTSAAPSLSIDTGQGDIALIGPNPFHQGFGDL